MMMIKIDAESRLCSANKAGQVLDFSNTSAYNMWFFVHAVSLGWHIKKVFFKRVLTHSNLL